MNKDRVQEPNYEHNLYSIHVDILTVACKCRHSKNVNIAERLDWPARDYDQRDDDGASKWGWRRIDGWCKTSTDVPSSSSWILCKCPWHASSYRSCYSVLLPPFLAPGSLLPPLQQLLRPPSPIAFHWTQSSLFLTFSLLRYYAHVGVDGERNLEFCLHVMGRGEERDFINRRRVRREIRFLRLCETESLDIYIGTLILSNESFSFYGQVDKALINSLIIISTTP